MIFQSSVGNIFGRIVYILAATWYGILWLLFCTLIVYEVIRLFLKINSYAAGVLIITIAAIASIYAMVNAQMIFVRRLTIPGDINCDIVQLSDIHIGSVGGAFLKRVIAKTNAVDPDLILITGDLVDNFNKSSQEALGLLARLEAPVYFVTGNHEHYVGAERITRLLTEIDVTVLSNQRIDHGAMQIIGIDDKTSKDNRENILRQLHTDNSRFSVLMSHRPMELETLSEAQVNLAVSGHTHAGQLFPFNYIVGLFYEHLSGLHQHNNTYLYVTSGAGTWGPRMRMGSRSEIVLLQIRKKLKPE